MEKLWFCALDISKLRIGIALGYPQLITPLKIIKCEDFKEELLKIKKQYKNVQFVIGLPHPRYNNFKFIKDFTHRYKELLKPFFFQEEDYSSILATDNKNQVHDDIAACVILESFFLSTCYNK